MISPMVQATRCLRCLELNSVMNLSHSNPFGSCLGFLASPSKTKVAVAVEDPMGMNVKVRAKL